MPSPSPDLGACGSSLGLLFRQVRDLLLTSMRGAAMTYTFDRRDPAADPLVGQWQDLARTLLDA